MLARRDEGEDGVRVDVYSEASVGIALSLVTILKVSRSEFLDGIRDGMDQQRYVGRTITK